MSFPTRPPLADIWKQFSNKAGSLKRYCAEFNASSAARAMSASDLETLLDHLAEFSRYAKVAAQTVGLPDYVKAQYADASLNIVAEYNTMIDTVDAAIDWIARNVPKAGGYVQLDQWALDGTRTRRTFSSNDLANLRTVLSTVIATIE